MTDNESNKHLEKWGLELAAQDKYAETRNIFREVLKSKSVPLHPAQVLRNIMLTYEREGNKEEAIDICNEILETPELWDSTDGVYLHGQITSHVRKLQGRSAWTSPSFSAFLSAYSAGAAIGALVGSKLQVVGHTFLG